MNERIEQLINKNFINECLDKDKLKEEKIDGKIYLMAPPSRGHRRVQGNLSAVFTNYFKQNKKNCEALIELRLNIDYHTYFEPDLMVFCYENDRENKEEIPIIVIEVLSKSTRGRDLGVKMKKYAQAGIKEYWIITWEMLSIDIYLLSDDGKYDLYKSYAHFTTDDWGINGNELPEQSTETEVITEFSPVSIPDLKIRLEDIFYFVTESPA
jgi:Uma2 family endonuclease